MKKALMFLFLILALALTACQPAASGDTGDVAETEEAGDIVEPETVSERCGDPDQLAEEIFLYTWVEYIDPDVMAQFEAECGVRVVETNFDSNETLLATIQAGGADYDIVVPSD